MTPKHKNIYEVVNLLVLIYSSQKNDPKLSEEQKLLLAIKEHHLEQAKISLPVFHNTLRYLYKRGYIQAIPILDNSEHDEIEKFISDKGYSEVLSHIPQNDPEFLTEQGKEKIAEDFQKVIPPNYRLDKSALNQDDTTQKEFLNFTRNVLKYHSRDVVEYVAVWPFRSVERLLEKLDEGQDFDEIQDSGTWYDPINYKFHFGNIVIDTSYQGKPNTEHFVLELFNEYVDDGVIGFEDIHAHTPPALKRAMIRFIDKDHKLKQLFTVHSTYVTINKDYLE